VGDFLVGSLCAQTTSRTTATEGKGGGMNVDATRVGGQALGGVLTPLLLTARQATKLCGKSLRTWRSWDAAGLIPQPIRIRRCTLWRAGELQAWIAAGCPRREEWDADRRKSA